jgi:hypothetical protein
MRCASSVVGGFVTARCDLGLVSCIVLTVTKASVGMLRADLDSVSACVSRHTALTDYAGPAERLFGLSNARTSAADSYAPWAMENFD